MNEHIYVSGFYLVLDDDDVLQCVVCTVHYTNAVHTDCNQLYM